MITKKIVELSEKFYEEVVELRHFFHMNPEIGFEEVKTAKKVADKLKALGIETKTNVAKTGVVGLIRGTSPGKTVLLRADMDALLIEEKADIPYKSKTDGKMHACGHDGHTAGLLGAAMILNELKDELKGNVKLIFQPNEENEGGALPMIEEGVLENPKVDAAFACHLWGNTKEGNIEVKSGAMMAAADMFEIKVVGKGGHAAMPHLSIDPIIMGSEIVNSFQNIISRRINPLLPSVLSVSYFHAGDTHNVIPNDVTIKGTIRTFDAEAREKIPKFMKKTVKNITEVYGGSYEFNLHKGFPALINNEEMTNLAKNSVSKIVGNENVMESQYPNMGAEDFAYFAKYVPSSFYFVGIVKEEDESVAHHNPYFEWDDKNLLIASQTLAQVAIDYLENN